MDEDALMRQVAAGDAAAFERLVRRCQPRLLRVATRLLGDADAAQDAAQEAQLRLWRIRARWQPGGSVEGFLLRTVRNLCLDITRARHPTEPLAAECHGDPDGPAGGVVGRVEARALAEAARQAVLALPEAQRAVFVLSQYEGLSYAEIAGILECPVGTVASRKHLAMQALRRRLCAWQEGHGAD